MSVSVASGDEPKNREDVTVRHVWQYLREEKV